MQQLLRSVLVTIQKWVLPKRKAITIALNTVSALLLGGLFFVFLQAQTNYVVVAPVVYFLSSKLGVVALVLYIATLLPGLLTRLQWWPEITLLMSSILMPFRRQLGVMMFIVAYMHMSFAATLPQLVMFDFDASKIIFSTYEWMGIFAWWSLFPLWLTSNDLSVRFLGKWWKRIHRFTYVSLFLIFLHVALQYTNWLYVVAGVGVLECVSWVRVWQREKNKPAAAVISQQ